MPKNVYDAHSKFPSTKNFQHLFQSRERFKGKKFKESRFPARKGGHRVVT